MEFLLLLCSIIICIINIRFVLATLILLHITCIHLHLQFRCIVTHILTPQTSLNPRGDVTGSGMSRTSGYSELWETNDKRCPFLYLSGLIIFSLNTLKHQSSSSLYQAQSFNLRINQNRHLTSSPSLININFNP